MKRAAPFVIGLAMVCAASSVRAATIHVPADQPTIQAGILAAVSGDTVLVAPGTYTEILTFAGRSIHLLSEGGPGVTTIQPSASLTTVVSMIAGEGGSISGFTFSGGSGPRVIDIRNGATPLLQDNVFRDFASYLQNAVVIGCQDANPTISYNQFFDNISTSTVGVFSGSAAILNNTFDNNARGFFSLSGTTVARNNIVTNSAGYGASGLFGDLDYNDIWLNSPDYGGGATAGAHSISAPPLYCDSTMRDYTIAAASPCIAAGAGGIDIGALGVGCTAPRPIVASITIAPPGDSLHVIDHTPEIMWEYSSSPEYPLTQSQIEVGSDDDWTTADLWQPPVIIGDAQSLTYAGVPLNDGQDFYVRVQVRNDTEESAWRSARFRMNSAPSVPILHAPLDGDSAGATGLSLIVENSADAEGDSLWYDFEIYADDELSSLVDSSYDRMEEPGLTASRTINSLAIGTAYWWRARSHDPFEYSDWSLPVHFVTIAYSLIFVPDHLPTIQAAIDASSPGGTIIVRPGTYTQNIDFGGKDIRLLGEKGTAASILLPANPAASTIRMINGEGPGSELSGFTVVGGSAQSVVEIRNGAAPLIRNNVFRNHDSEVQNAVSILCRDSDPIISGNLFYHNRSISCIGIFSGTATITGNTFDDNARGFFTISDQGTAVNNIVTNSTDYGIYGSFTLLSHNCTYHNDPDYDGGAVPGPGSLTADPRFCDTVARDYRLDPSSPCVGAGSGGVDMGALDVGCLAPCACPCHGDPECDGVSNVLDVVKAVNVSFRGATPSADPDCPYEQTDVSCDGATNVIDVVKFVNVTFRTGDPATEFCYPCAP